MTVYLVGAGPGDPGLLTCKGRDVLARADVVVYDRLVSKRLLTLAPPDAILRDMGKRPGSPNRQQEINDLLAEYAATYQVVVRLKGGDPLLFGRGVEEAEPLIEAGVNVEIVPGVTAAIGVLSAAGIPVTRRGVASLVTIVTGHTEDATAQAAGADTNDAGKSSDPAGARPDWETLAKLEGTLVVLMGVERRAEIARRLIEGGMAPTTAVAAVEEGTTARQKVVRCTLGELGSTPITAPAVIAIGRTAELDAIGDAAGSSDSSRELSGLSVVVTRARSQSGELAELLEEAGAEVISLPVVRFDSPADGGVDLKRHVNWIHRYDWVVFTSVNGVERFFAELRDSRDLGGVRVAAVGEATARALLERSVVADLIPEGRHSAKGLIEAMPAPGPVASRRETGRILYPKAAAAGTALAEGLRRKGWLVDEVEAYTTVTLTHDDGIAGELIDAAGEADAITFTSPSTVNAYLSLAGNGKVPSVVACLGPATASAARDAGLAVDVVAKSQSARGLVDGLITFKKKLG